MRLKTYKMAISILPKFLTLKWNISRTVWRIEVGNGSFFYIFHVLSFELNFCLDRRWPLKLYQTIHITESFTKFSLRLKGSLYDLVYIYCSYSLQVYHVSRKGYTKGRILLTRFYKIPNHKLRMYKNHS